MRGHVVVLVGSNSIGSGKPQRPAMQQAAENPSVDVAKYVNQLGRSAGRGRTEVSCSSCRPPRPQYATAWD
jgi:hypothetical protein